MDQDINDEKIENNEISEIVNEIYSNYLYIIRIINFKIKDFYQIQIAYLNLYIDYLMIYIIIQKMNLIITLAYLLEILMIYSF